MRQIILSVSLSLVILLAACKPSAPVPSPSPIPPTPTVAMSLAPQSPATNAAVPGGVDVAMKLVKIPNQPNIAVVDGTPVTTAAYQEELNRALVAVTSQYEVDWNDPNNQAPLPALQEQVLDQIIQRTVLRRLASQEGVSVSSTDVESETLALKIRVMSSGQFPDWAVFLKQNGLTEDYVRSLIADNLLFESMSKRHTGPTNVEQVHASHILVATKETGQEVLDKLAKGEAFADLAAQYSTDTGSKGQGGDLGWFPRGAMVPAFEQAAFSQEPGKVGPLVQSDYGYHIILVHEKAVRELDPSLAQQMQQGQFETWLGEQQAKLNVERLYTFDTSK